MSVQAPVSTCTPVGDGVDLLLCSPDGESRGAWPRVGDLFALDPWQHVISARGEPASPVRPWGLRYLVPPQPRAGKHEGSSNTTTGTTDGNTGGEESSSD